MFTCRYIPLKRFLLPSALAGDELLSNSGIPSPVLFEEIGQGASGASVRRCKFGELTAAAKVFPFLDHLILNLSLSNDESSPGDICTLQGLLMVVL